jgi:outer membrane receptor protein involved in Fe transport
VDVTALVESRRNGENGRRHQSFFHWSSIKMRVFFHGCALMALIVTSAARLSATTIRGSGPDSPGHALAVDFTGTVTDTATGQPLPAAEVSVSSQGGKVVANTTTDAFGRYTIHNVGTGSYAVVVHFIGFKPVTRRVTVSATDATTKRLDFALKPVVSMLEAVQVTASTPVAVETRTGDQVFQASETHLAPVVTTQQILQQSIVGAARAPTGEVHIRGQHAEYTYYIDGVPVPSGISGSLNELFDPQVVNQIKFETGGWDAEYGNKNTAIVNITTRVPAGGFHLNAGSYAGAFDGSTTVGPKNLNGQSLSLSNNRGPWGFFVSGSRQYSDMRREPVVFDTSGSKVINFHNSGHDEFGFAKVQYTPSTSDVFSLDANLSQTHFQVPFDSSGNVFQDDHQRDVNSFVNLGWHHQFGGGAAEQSSGEFFGGVFFRHGGLTYTPNSQDEPQFVFFPDTTAFNLTENRNFNTYGAKLDYTIKPANELEFKVGTQASGTTGHEDFSTISPTGRTGPASNSGLNGSDVGVYAQTAYSPTEWAEIRTGVRYDAHTAPFAGTETQVSPRIRLNLRPSQTTTLYAYYGRLFMPTNVEDLRAITSVAQQGVATTPTLPERDNFYEAGLIQRIPAADLSFKGAYFYKVSEPGIDDNTVPGSNIVTSVNIAKVKVTGLEGVLEYRPNGPFSAYANAALTHAYGVGPITGGFFPEDTPQGFFDLDHDQRLSLAASGTYSPSHFFLTATGIYGSGLTNGVDPADCNCSFGTGLFDFNQGIHVDPSAILNLSAGYSFAAVGTLLQPQIYVENALNKKYLLKGAFFSGAAVGRPRSIQIRLNLSY